MGLEFSDNALNEKVIVNIVNKNFIILIYTI